MEDLNFSFIPGGVIKFRHEKEYFYKTNGSIICREFAEMCGIDFPIDMEIYQLSQEEKKIYPKTEMLFGDNNDFDDVKIDQKTFDKIEKLINLYNLLPPSHEEKRRETFDEIIILLKK